jgi:hypothetical protein
VIHLIVVSLNQPTICPNATWSLNGSTFANNNTVGTYPYALFVDANNAVYVAETNNNRVQVWAQGSVNPTRNITGGFSAPHAVCATTNGNIFIENGANYEVVMWTSNSTSGVWVMGVSGRCMGLYVDTNNTLYCSMDGYQKVIAKSLNNGSSANYTVAGTGTAGSTANTLHYPNGIVVDLKFNLYVADWGNNRVQMFSYGQLNATTVAGSGATGTITLSGPTGVMVDANGYLYIADYSNARIVGQGPYGFRCVVGCSGVSGSSPSQLNSPQNLGFDSYGNIYVADSSNNRVQVFLLTNNSCTTSG